MYVRPFSRALASAVSFGLPLLPIGCATSLPGPRLTRHTQDSYVDVPYTPPAALAETVPEIARPAGAVWVDGDWNFRGKSYVWRRGGWFLPRDGVTYARSEVIYLDDGRVQYAPATWYDEQHQPISERPSRLAPAATPPNEITGEFGAGR